MAGQAVSLGELLEVVPEAVLVIGRDGRVARANAQAGRVFGAARRELEGADFDRLTPPALRDRFRRLLANLLANGGVLAVGEAAPLHLLRWGGEPFPVELSVGVVEIDGVPHLLGTVRDVTSQREAAARVEDALERAERERERLRVLLSVLPVAVEMLAGDGPIVEVNPAARRLWAEGALACAPRRVEGGRVGEPVGCCLRRALGGETVVEELVEVETATGPGRRLLCSAVALPGGGAVSVSQDVTRLAEAEARIAEQARRLERSNADLEKFATVASHDLRDPLRMVVSYLELLARDGHVVDPGGRDLLARADAGARRLDRLVLGLLEFSRSSTHDPERRPVEVGRALDDALANLDSVVRQEGARVLRDEPLPCVLADEVQLTQVFQNLVSNALRYRGAAEPEIRVRAVREGLEWRICVSDNGPGVAPDDRERIFRAFQRGNGGGSGLGLGLALVRRIVERHGGRIWVEAEPGGGAAFWFTLLAADPSPVS